MEIKQLASFVRVADLGSFSRAADVMQMAQPLLSRHVRQLEVELGHSLLHRNGRGVTLTPAGQVLLGHARGLLHQVALATEELGALRGALTGRVSVGLPPSLAKLITVPLMQAFRRELPRARLTLTEGFSVVLMDGLRTGRVDLAVMYNPPSAPDIEVTTLHDDALVVISPRQGLRTALAADAPVTLAQLATLPLIAPSRPNAFRLLLDSELAKLGHKPHIVIEIDGLNAILDLVCEGLGCAVLPRYTLQAQPDAAIRLQTHTVAAEALRCQLCLVRSALRPSTTTQQRAQALLLNTIGEKLR